MFSINQLGELLRTVKSGAMYSVLWALALVSVVFLFFAYLMRASAIMWVLVACPVALVGLFCYGFIFLLKNDPDRLHGERFQIQKHVITAVQSQDIVEVLKALGPAAFNPDLRLPLPPGQLPGTGLTIEPPRASSNAEPGSKED